MERRELKILATGGLGDCLLLTPFIRHFRAAGRHHTITVATAAPAASLFDTNPHVDRVIACAGGDLYLWGLEEPGCDVFAPYMEVRWADPGDGGMPRVQATPLHDLSRGDRPAGEQLARYFGLPVTDFSLEVHPTAEDRLWAEEATRPWRDRPLIFCHAESPYERKEYPAGSWRQAVDALREDGQCLTVIERTGAELDIPVIAPLPNPRRTAALFERMAVVLTIDSFPGHLAAAVGVGAVVLFGPSNPRVFGHPTNTNLRMGDCPMCMDTERLLACQRSECLEAIPPAAVVAAVRERLAAFTADGPAPDHYSDGASGSPR